jgi:hypothetical protein
MISIKNKIASKIIIFLTAVYAKSIFAQDPTSAEENRVRAIHVTWDNDRFVKGGTDQWYTNGFRVDWTYERNPKNSAASLLASGVDALNDNGPNRSISYSVGQLLYTPKTLGNPSHNLTTDHGEPSCMQDWHHMRTPETETYIRAPN